MEGSSAFLKFFEVHLVLATIFSLIASFFTFYDIVGVEEEAAESQA